MELGIFAKTFTRPSVDAVFAAAAQVDLRVVQFNMASAGLPSLPGTVPSDLIDQIQLAAREHDVRIAALSATFNLIHADHAVRERGFASLDVLCGVAATLQIPLVSLCTGTRDADDMWRGHPDNSSALAWQEMIAGLRRATGIAERWDVRLGIEPEPGNVVCDAKAAARALHELGTTRIGIIFDPANVIAGAPEVTPERTLDAALRLLGPAITLAHGKDVRPDGTACAPGRGLVPWPRFVGMLQAAGYGGPLILHGFPEADLTAALAHLRAVDGVDR